MPFDIKIRGSYPPPSPSELQEFERAWAVRLPTVFRDFLLAHNGGCSDTSWVWQDGEVILGFSLFLPLNADSHDTIAYYMKCEYFPPSMVPFAISNGSDFFLIGCRPTVFGKIYYWKHDQQWEPDGTWDRVPSRILDVLVGTLKKCSAPKYENLQYLAPCFQDFLAMLRGFEGPPEWGLGVHCQLCRANAITDIREMLAECSADARDETLNRFMQCACRVARWETVQEIHRLGASPAGMLPSAICGESPDLPGIVSYLIEAGESLDFQAYNPNWMPSVQQEHGLMGPLELAQTRHWHAGNIKWKEPLIALIQQHLPPTVAPDAGSSGV